MTGSTTTEAIEAEAVETLDAPASEPAATESAAAAASQPQTSVPNAGRKAPKLHIAHKVPGRIRLKVHKGKAHPELLALYQEIFSQVPGISSVKTKPETGSVIINYDVHRESQFEAHFSRLYNSQPGAQHARPGDEINELAHKIEAEANFLAERSELAKIAVDFFKSMDHELKNATGNAIDLKVVLFGGLTVITFLELGAHAATPMWVTLGLFAVNHLAELQQQDSPAPAVAAR